MPFGLGGSEFGVKSGCCVGQEFAYCRAALEVV